MTGELTPEEQAQIVTAAIKDLRVQLLQTKIQLVMNFRSKAPPAEIAAIEERIVCLTLGINDLENTFADSLTPPSHPPVGAGPSAGPLPNTPEPKPPAVRKQNKKCP